MVGSAHPIECQPGVTFKLLDLAISSAIALNNQRPGSGPSKPLSLPEVNILIVGLQEDEGRQGSR